MAPLNNDIGALGSALDVLVDSSVGVIRRIFEVAREPGSPEFFHFAARAANTNAFGFLENFGNTGGASSDKATAIAKACGEAIERYCAAIYEVGSLPFGKADDFGENCISPAKFALYSPRQLNAAGFPWARFDERSPIRWTPVVQIRDQVVRYAPAAFVWIPYSFDKSIGEAPIGQPISTGLACHESWERATLGGLCEAIERDAFTIFWQARGAPPRVRVETLSDLNYDLVRRFEQTGDEVQLLNLTNDIGVPVLLAVLRSHSKQRPAHVFAAAADPNPEVCARKALEELAHTRRYSEQCLRLMPCPSPDNEFEDVEHQAHHLRFAADHSMAEAFAFAFESPHWQEFDEIPRKVLAPAEALEFVTTRLSAVGIECFAADLTSPDVRALGLTVVRVVAPGLHPLFMGHRLRALGGKRLRSVPQRMGYKGLGPDEDDNPFPHPYP